MANPIIPRAWVHEHSDAIGAHQEDHQAALNRLLAQQRRLTRFLEENREQMGPATAGVSLYLYGVLARLYDLSGGQLRAATWEQVRDAERKVKAQVPALLPLDDQFAERARKADRAQPHLLDEALMALFSREKPVAGEADLGDAEAAKVYLLMWVANEVLDACWHPPKGFVGDATYAYVHIETDKAKA